MISTETNRLSLEDRIWAVAEEVLAEDSHFLVDLAIRGHKGSRSVEIYVDGDEGVNVDELARVSRRLGFLIESEGMIHGTYTLTVSSPGDRFAFKLPRQFGKHVGKQLDLRINQAKSDKETESVSGKLTSVSKNSLTLEVQNGENREIEFESITNAKVILPW